MDELCPLCLKVGAKRKIKAIQVNLTEALWMCENEECPWPFGHKAPKIFHRKVGEKWSFEWQVYRKVQKSVGPIPISTELSLYTPPVTPSSDAASKDSSKADISTNINDLTNSNNPNNAIPRDSYAPRSTDQVISGIAQASIDNFVSSDRKDVANQAVLSSIFDIDGDELLDKINFQPISVDSLTDDLDVRNADRDVKVLEKCSKSRKSVEKKKLVIETETKAVPSIRSIAKANIDLQRFNPSEIVTNKQVESFEKGRFTFDIEPATPPSDVNDKLNLPNSDCNILKQHTTTIKVEGIPPITLSYDLADLGGKTSTPIQKPAKRIFVETRIKVEKPEIAEESPKKQVKSSEKRRTALGKRYEKFSFSKLRKTGQEAKESSDKSNILTAETILVKKEDVGLDGTILDDKKHVSLGAESLVRGSSATSHTVAAEDTRINTLNGIESVKKEDTRVGEAVSDYKKQDSESLVPNSLDGIKSSKKEEMEVGEGISNSESLVPNLSATSDTVIAHDPEITDLDLTKSFNRSDGSINCLANDSQSVENLSVGCLLDDMLLDNYRDDSKNLNDDWLESFFT